MRSSLIALLLITSLASAQCPDGKCPNQSTPIIVPFKTPCPCPDCQPAFSVFEPRIVVDTECRQYQPKCHCPPPCHCKPQRHRFGLLYRFGGRR